MTLYPQQQPRPCVSSYSADPMEAKWKKHQAQSKGEHGLQEEGTDHRREDTEGGLASSCLRGGDLETSRSLCHKENKTSPPLQGGSSSSGALEGREGRRGMPELGMPSEKSLPMLSGPHSGAPSAQPPPGGTSQGCAGYFELWRREKGICQLSELNKAEPPTPHIPHWCTKPPLLGNRAQYRHRGEPTVPHWHLC